MTIVDVIPDAEILDLIVSANAVMDRQNAPKKNRHVRIPAELFDRLTKYYGDSPENVFIFVDGIRVLSEGID